MSKQYCREYKIECRIKIFFADYCKYTWELFWNRKQEVFNYDLQDRKSNNHLDSTYIIITKFNKTDSNAQEFKNPFISIIYCLL